MKINLFNNTKYRLDKNLTESIEKILNTFEKKLSGKQLNLILTSQNEIIKLNKEFFKKSGPTDVISVNNPSSDKFLGDIYICPDIISKNVSLYKEAYPTELTRIIIHGILHLLGYDHIKPFGEEQNKMFELQEELLKKVLKLSNYKYAAKGT